MFFLGQKELGYGGALVYMTSELDIIRDGILIFCSVLVRVMET